MKTAILTFICFVSIFSFGQKTDKLVAEVSPIMASIHTGYSHNIHGKLSYSFNKYLSLSARHNQELFGSKISSTQSLSPNPYRKNSLTDIQLGITLVNSPKLTIDPTEEHRSWFHKQLQLDLGLNYYKFAATRTDYYSYNTDDQGNYKVISSINRFSASLGFSYILREYNIKELADIKLKRQHTISAGAYYGLNYDLQGYIKIPGENPYERAPKDYSFKRGGYYIRYNFRQQINKHLFLGADLLFARMPQVEYKSNPNLFLFRGGEAEPKFQPYAGITIGWAF